MTSSGIGSLMFGLVLLFSHSLSAEPLEVAVTHFPPQFVVDADGGISGPLVDVLTQTLDAVGVSYYLVSYPPKRLLRNLKSGESKIALGIKTTTANGIASALYSKKAVHRIELRILSLNSTRLPEEISGLMGESIGLIRGYQYGFRRALLAKSETTRIVDLNGHRAGLGMLINGRIRFLLDYKQPVESVITVEQSKLIHHKTIQEIDMFFIVSKTVNDAEGLMQSMENIHFGGIR